MLIIVQESRMCNLLKKNSPQVVQIKNGIAVWNVISVDKEK